MTHRIECADVREWATQYEGEPFDAVLCDPPYEIGFMGKAFDRTGVAHDKETWRLIGQHLNPGAHLLAFGGTRTFHRLACAIEDAGFEVRDCLSWLYATGFPKSLDISKAIDKARDDRADILRVTAFVRAARDAAGLSNQQIDAHFGTNGMAGHWTSSASQPAVPTWGQWRELRSLLGVGAEMDAEVWRLNGRKGKPGEAWEEREVVGRRTDGCGNTEASIHKSEGFAASRSAEFDVTAPATDAARQWHGYGTALKPAWEPCIVAMKPTDGTFAENALRHGVAGLNIDGGRIGTEKSIPNGTRSGSLGREGTSGYQGGWGARDATQSGCNPTLGRWPANLLLDEEAARLLDEMSGFLHAPGFVNPSHIPSGRYKSQSIGRGIGDGRKPFDYKDGGGGASRFFYCAKSSRREREAGLEGLPQTNASQRYGGVQDARPHTGEDYEYPRPQARNHHPTVKPLALCEYLARLILPPKRDTPRRLLVPFSGSGSEMIGALLAGWDEVVGIEREAEYAAIAEARLAHWTKGKAEEADGGQMEPSA